jgi:hypothetical protein
MQYDERLFLLYLASRAGRRCEGTDMTQPDRGHGSGETAYEIKFWGALEGDWSDWFNGMSMTMERGAEGRALTTLTGPVADQAKLRGILARIWDLNLVVVAVHRLDRPR